LPGRNSGSWKQAGENSCDAQETVRVLSLKSYEGGYKIEDYLMADKMNIAASNKLLKTVEEPTDRTLSLPDCRKRRRRYYSNHFNTLPNIAFQWFEWKIILPKG
jgi:hypothetical protein